jgi:tetratricopeptide (TPR) repeat protein
VAIDRDALIRHAEQFLQQGKLAQAIAEYRRIVDDEPRDWNTANLLGDLYLRAGETDKAVTEYRRVAGSLSQDGFLAKAGAIYKKILKIAPHDEQVLLQAADVAAAQKLVVDARAHLNTVYEQRRSRGDDVGAEEVSVRLAALDPEAAIANRLEQLEAQAPMQPHDLQPAVEPPIPVASLPAIEPQIVAQTIVDRASSKPEVIELATAAPAAAHQPAPAPAAQAAARQSVPAGDLDGFFADLREEAALRSTKKSPEEELAVGLAFFSAGEEELAVPRLEAALRSPASRFIAAATLGRICVGRGDTLPAIEWFERAAEAQAPTPADGHRLLYELADALEGIGETARALAVCLELQTEAGDYEDVATRVDRLSKVQARG